MTSIYTLKEIFKMNSMIGKNSIIKLLIVFLIVSACNPQPNDINAEWKKMNASKEEECKRFDDLKYGMFIHWGLYSIPGGIWKGKKMEDMGGGTYVSEWVQYVFKIPRAEYAQLASEFNPVKFNADSIVQLAKDAGMKFIVITSKHHDGFAMYDSKVSKFDIMDATPFKRDIIEELYKSCKKNGIDFGLYYSHNIDWADGGDCQYSVIKKFRAEKGDSTRIFGPNLWDPSPNTFDEYLNNKAFPQVREILTKFPGLSTLWYDMSMSMTPEQSFQFYKIAYDIQPNTLINDRIGNNFGDFDGAGDNKIPTGEMKFTRPWQTVGTTNNSWGYKSYDNDYKSIKELLFWIVEIVSKGGNYMLNVGPTAEGTVPEECARNLRETGRWLKLNGDAIYGTRKWKVQKEGPTNIVMTGTTQRQFSKFQANYSPSDFWFTTKDSNVYAIALAYPDNNIAKINSLKADTGTVVKTVRLLATKEDLKFRQTSNDLEVELPAGQKNPNGFVLEIQLKK